MADVELEKLSCGSCGAGLSLPKKATFVTCTFCKASLRVRHEGGAAFTEIREQVEELGREVAALKAQNHLIKLQADRQQLDRWWESHRWSLTVRGRYGRIVPKKIHAIVIAMIFGTCVFMTILGAFTASSSAGSSNGDPRMLLLMGGVGLLLGTFLTLRRWGQAKKYDAGRADYLARRAKFDAAIAAAEKR